MRRQTLFFNEAIVITTLLVIAFEPIAHADDAKTSCWHTVNKTFTPVKRAADVELFQNDQRAVTAMDLDADLLLSFDASNGQLLTRFGPREGNSQCLLRGGEKILLVQDKRRGPELCTFSVAELRQEKAITLPDFRLYRITSAAISRDGRYLWLTSSRTLSDLYGEINSARFRVDLQTGDCKLVLGSREERVDRRSIPNLAYPQKSDYHWLVCSSASGEILVADIHTNRLLAFVGDALEPSKTIQIPFIPTVMPRECGRILPVATCNKIAFVDLVEGKVTDLEIEGPALAACLSSDGKTAFFSVAEKNEVLQINLPTGSLLRPVDFCRQNGRRNARDAREGYDTYDISVLRWADSPPRLIGLGYNGYILMIANLVQTS